MLPLLKCVALRLKSTQLAPLLIAWPRCFTVCRAGFKFEDTSDLPLLQQRETEKVAILVVSGDRGLCGGYNTNVIRRGEIRAKELEAEGLEYTYVLVGRKAIQYFERRKAPIAAKYTGLEQIPTADEASTISEELLSLFLSESVDRVELVYTKFLSLISNKPVYSDAFAFRPPGFRSSRR